MLFKWPKKNIQEYEDNIFRSLSKKTDSECKFLTQLNFQHCYYEKSDDKKNIIKKTSKEIVKFVKENDNEEKYAEFLQAQIHR